MLHSPKAISTYALRDTLGSIYIDEDFADLFSIIGKPALAPWRLALICIMQYMENLSDRQVAEAVRGRIDWKYLLSLPLDDHGFDFSILSEFRTRLLEGGKEELLLERILEELASRGLTIRSQKEYVALSARRQEQSTPEFLKTYAQRAGIEGTLSQGIRRAGLRQSRYIGLAKTHLQHILIAAALNLCRVNDWFNDVPLATTRYSRFTNLKPKTG